MTKATLEAKLQDLEVRYEKAKADAHAFEGALQLARHLLNVWDQPDTAPVDPEKGIPVEQLFPGATVTAEEPVPA